MTRAKRNEIALKIAQDVTVWEDIVARIEDSLKAEYRLNNRVEWRTFLEDLQKARITAAKTLEERRAELTTALAADLTTAAVEDLLSKVRTNEVDAE